MLNKDEVLRQNANKHICGMFKVRKELIRYPWKSPHLLFYFLKHQGEIVYRRSDIFKALSAKKWLYNRVDKWQMLLMRLTLMKAYLHRS